jgi:hypothetical protein
MHISLDQAIGRQPRLNRVEQSLLNIASGASAAYSLRSLTGDEPRAVRIRRDGDNEERDFTTAEIETEAADWTNGKQETTLPAELPSTSSSITGFTISGTSDASSGTYTTDGTLLNGKLFFKKTGANDEQVRYDGSKWLIWDDDEGEAYWIPTNNQDTEFPWDVTSWQVGSGGGGPVAFSSFVGGNPDNSAAAAYSLRKVKSDYTGPAVRIRRESDDIDADVAFDTNDTVSNDSIVTEVISGNQSTLQAFISGTNAAVAIWYDQSGNSKNATQTTDANQPLIAESGSLHTDDGKPALKFNGTSHRLELSAKATIANTSIFSAFRSNNNTQDSVLFHLAVNASNAVSIGLGDLATRTELGSRLRVGGSNVVEVGDNTFTSTSQSLLSYIASSSAAKMFVDSTEETNTVQARTSGGNSRIGGRGDDDKFFNGDISEIILFDSDQTNNRFKIESNINNHYTIYTAAQNGFVNTWYDQSGNGFNAVADADANEPKIVNSGSLLTDGVKFSSGNNLKLSGTGLDIFKNIQHAQVFYVIKINDTSTALTGFFEAQKNAFQARFLLRNSNATAGRISLGGRRLDSDDFVSFQSDSGHSNEKIVLTGFINYSDAEAFIFQNGTQIGSRTSFLTAGATSDTRSANIAIGRASASLTAEFDAEELIIFNTDQTANRTAIETNIANAHGITLS